MSTFTHDQTHFLLDGQPFRILAGAMHYFRVHPRCWKDRMLKMRAGSVVVASGGFEQPAVFRYNDLPGIMLASAAQRIQPGVGDHHG